MGKEQDIIVRETVAASGTDQAGTVVTLAALKEKAPSFEKKLPTIAKNLVERLLPYFITQDYTCPEIILSERDGRGAIRLNEFVSDELSAGIWEIETEQNSFTLQATDSEEEFLVRIFKIYSPRNQRSRISLVAHKREVSGSVLHKYIPEFEEEFYEKDSNGEIDRERNYIVKAYVFGSYLDCNVSLERGGFEFPMDPGLFLGISQSEIEKDAAAIARDAVGMDIMLRQEKKKERVQSYVDNEAPWYKSMLEEIDLSRMPYNPTDEKIETHLHREKFSRDIAIKQDVTRILSETSFENAKESVIEIVSKISDTSKDKLIHYIVLRKQIIDLFRKEP